MSARVVDDVGDDLIASCSIAGSHGISLDAHADRRCVDDDVALGESLGGRPTTPMPPANDAAASARSVERLTTVIDAAPARATASTIARAAPPAPSTHTRLSGDVDTVGRRARQRSPSPSVL